MHPAEPAHGNRPPAYPQAAALLGEQGKVTLRVHVAADGSVAAVEVLKSSGSPRLDQAARRQAASAWHFRPALRDGRPVADLFDLNVDFVLD